MPTKSLTSSLPIEKCRARLETTLPVFPSKLQVTQVPCLIWHRPDLFEICFEQPKFIGNGSANLAGYHNYQREIEPWIEFRGQLVGVSTGTQIELFVKTNFFFLSTAIPTFFFLIFGCSIVVNVLANIIKTGWGIAIPLAICLLLLAYRDWFRSEVKKQVQFVKELLEVHSEGKWVDDPYIERFFVPTGSYQHHIYEQAAELKQQQTAEIAQTYALLGDEVGPKTCQTPRCDHLTVPYSSFCRKHHMEMLYGPAGVAYWYQQELQNKLDS